MIQFTSLRNIIVSHFGINPVKGGSPPKDNKVILNIIVIVKEFIIMLGIWENDKAFQVCIMINIGIIMAVYIIKYIIGIIGRFIIKLPIIHPIWVMDEYAKIVRIWVWFIPSKPPIIALRAPVIINRGFKWYELVKGRINNIKGPSFCQVHKIRQLIHDSDVIVDGNQKWHGAAPSFRSRAINNSPCIKNWLTGFWRSILE